MLTLLTQIDKLFAWYIFSLIRRRTFYLEFIYPCFPSSPFKRPISLKAMQRKQSLFRLLRYAKQNRLFWTFFSHFIFLKCLEQINGNLVESYSIIERHDKVLCQTRERKKGKLDWGAVAKCTFQPFIFCCNGDAPSKATIHRRTHLFQPNAPHSMLREHFDGYRLWQGAFFTRCFIYLKWFNCFDLIQTQSTRPRSGVHRKGKENIRPF